MSCIACKRSYLLGSLFFSIKAAIGNSLIMMRVLVTNVIVPLIIPGVVIAQVDCEFHIASFNIHYIVPGDATDDWDKRKQAVTQVLKDMDADILAFQEMETFGGGHYNTQNVQLEWLQSTVPGYQIAATGDPNMFPSTQPIFFKANKYTVVDQGFFFFSNTPDEIYSEQWNGGYPYFCTWARFHSRCSENDFFVFNVHNDYSSRVNRLKTSKLIADRIEKVVPKGIPTIVLGDFNVPKGFKEIRLLEAIGLSVVPPNGTTRRILGINIMPAIDHILISKGFRLKSDIKVWQNRYDGIYPADHYPISVKLSFEPLRRKD